MSHHDPSTVTTWHLDHLVHISSFYSNLTVTFTRTSSTTHLDPCKGFKLSEHIALLRSFRRFTCKADWDKKKSASWSRNKHLGERVDLETTELLPLLAEKNIYLAIDTQLGEKKSSSIAWVPYDVHSFHWVNQSLHSWGSHKKNNAAITFDFPAEHWQVWCALAKYDSNSKEDLLHSPRQNSRAKFKNQTRTALGFWNVLNKPPFEACCFIHGSSWDWLICLHRIHSKQAVFQAAQPYHFLSTVDLSRSYLSDRGEICGQMWRPKP